KTTTISPNAIVWLQGIYTSYAVGANLSISSFSLGAFYKSALKSSAHFLSLSAGYSGAWFALGYSFDVGKISRAAGGYLPNTHEVSLIFKVKKRQRDSFRRQWETPYKVQNTPIL
ncbi:MAG: hypothetical protein LBU92_02465, partial [Prevotellaceae bacterium]|nr:hypothetical protein [Prevotellaceae bacterium]